MHVHGAMTRRAMSATVSLSLSLPLSIVPPVPSPACSTLLTLLPPSRLLFPSGSMRRGAFSPFRASSSKNGHRTGHAASARAYRCLDIKIYNELTCALRLPLRGKEE